jgi:hypothetical protein
MAKRRLTSWFATATFLMACGVPAAEQLNGSQPYDDELEIGTTSQAVHIPVLHPFPYEELPIELKNMNSGKCMDVAGAGTSSGTQVNQFTCHGQANQSFHLVKISGSDYELRADHAPGMSLNVAGGGSDSGAQVQIYDSSSVQRFRLIMSDDGSANILAMASNKCLAVSGASRSDGAPVQQFTCDGSKNQRWFINWRPASMNFIAKHSQKCVDVISASSDNNANVQQFDCNAGDNQHWFLRDAGPNGDFRFYNIVATHSGKCLDVAGASTANNANVQQFGCNGGDNQKWAISEVAGGYTVLVNKLSGKCLDVAGAETGNNANIQQFDCNGGDNQKFYWARFSERHIQVVQVARTNGRDRLLAQDAAYQAHVARANGIFQRYGLKLVYDPATDKSNANSDGLFTVGTGDERILFCADGSAGTGVECAQRHAANFPDKVVIFNRPGAEYSDGHLNFIAIGGPQLRTVCGDLPDTEWLALSLGGYMGLDFVFGQLYESKLAASLAFQQNGSSIFDDGLEDTRPSPMYVGLDDCLSPHSPLTFVPVTNSFGSETNFVADADNLMNLFYNANPKITPMQAAIVRATAVARGF